MKHKTLKAVAVGAVALLASACSGQDPLQSGGGNASGDTIVVGSANFPGNVLIAEVYASALEEAGFKVERKLNIGAREVLYSQVENCTLSVVPEYNQALLAYIDPEFTARGTEEVDTALAAALPENLSVLDSSSAEDNNAIAVSADTAKKHNLKTIGDLAKVSSTMKFGGPTEWEARADGYPSIKAAYGVDFTEYKLLDYSGPITISALEKGDVDAALLFSTVPQISSMNFVVLQDPENALGVNNVTPLVCDAKMPKEAQELLNRLSAKLTTADLVDMNVAFSLDFRDADEVAAEWVSKQGLK